VKIVEEENKKILIAYFSWDGNTKIIAQKIQAQIKGDLFEIKCAKPYSSNYQTVLNKSKLKSKHYKEVSFMAEIEVLKVAANSKPVAVAGALAAIIREKGVAELQAIGAGAVNQAVKAIAIARGYVAPSGIDLVCVPAFADVEIEGEERTAIKFLVKPKE
jgi:stage V sporulation protein S